MSLLSETAADPTDAAAFAAARQRCKKILGDLYFAASFLTRSKRDAVCALLAFCRMIHDAIDLPHGATHAPDEPADCSDSLPQRLDMFRDRLDEIYSHRLELPLPKFRSPEQHILHAATRTVHRFEIPKDYFLDLAEGRRLEITTPRYATWNALAKTIYHSAGVIGPMIGSVLGLTHSQAAQRLVQLAAAIRLIHAVQDIRTDYDRGRILLPLEDLARFRYSERDLGRGVTNDNFRDLMRFQIERIRGLIREGADGICWLADDGSRVAVAAVALFHGAILDEIERRRYEIPAAPLVPSRTVQLRLLPAIWRLARRETHQPLPTI